MDPRSQFGIKSSQGGNEGEGIEPVTSFRQANHEDFLKLEMISLQLC